MTRVNLHRRHVYYYVEYTYPLRSSKIKGKAYLTTVDAHNINRLKEAGKSLSIRVFWRFSDIDHKQIDKLI